MAIHGATFWIGACRQSLLASSLTLSHLVQRLNCARCTRYIDAPPHETTAGPRETSVPHLLGHVVQSVS